MYHILASEGQAQFRAGQTIDDGWRHPFCQCQQFAPPVRGAVGSFYKHRNPAGAIEGPRHNVKTNDKLSSATRETDFSRETSHQQSFHQGRNIGCHRDRRAGSLRKMAPGDSAFKNAPLRRNPHSAAGQSCRNIRHQLSLRIDPEANKTTFGKCFARNDATTLAHSPSSVCFCLGQSRHHSALCSSSSADSSISCSAGASIQPAFTRASMMMMFASSAVRLNFSSAPGTRTRSLSLPTS